MFCLTHELRCQQNKHKECARKIQLHIQPDARVEMCDKKNDRREYAVRDVRMTHGREGSLLYIKITVCVREVVSNFEHLKGWPVMKKTERF